MPARIALTLALLSLALPASAQATVSVTVSKATQRVLINDDTGAADQVSVSIGAQSVTVESLQPFSSLSGCNSASPDPAVGRPRAICSGTDVRGITATLNAGNDTWTTTSGSFGGGALNAVVASGGAGADVFNGGLDSETFNGGADGDVLNIRRGFDTARGEGGNDTIVEEEPGAVGDTIDGGTETDKLVLERASGVTIADRDSTADVFRDAALRPAAELEESPAGIEAFEGTHAPDVINGALSTGLGDRSYNGRGGNDVVLGTPRSDRLAGGNGRDLIRGNDGNDGLDAKAGEGAAVPDEQLDCGGGTDSALIDLTDPEPVGCESISRSAIREGPHVRIGRVRRARGRSVRVGLRCPRSLGHRCRGRLEVALTRRGLRPAPGARYSIRAGRSATVRVRLMRRDARRLRGRRVRRGLVRSTERGDVAGRKTTLGVRRIRR